MIDFLRRITPRLLKQLYHRMLSLLAAAWYGHPSRQLLVIGVTGTDGKTTTATMIAQLFMDAGWRVGLSTSVWQQVGERRWMNESHVTMPGRFALHRLLREMVTAKCRVAVVEISSEGVAQSRHLGIDFDAAVWTNLSPEHIESHGTFEKYRATKGRLFAQLKRSKKKHLSGQSVPKISVVNLDDPNAEYFLKFPAEQHHGVSLEQSSQLLATPEAKLKVWRAENIVSYERHNTFSLNGEMVKLSLPGRVNILNALETMAVAVTYGLSMTSIKKSLAAMPAVPGRYEDIPNTRGIRVVVDYALTPSALEQLYRTLQPATGKRLLAVFGAAGGGRDTWKRPELGRIAAQYCQVIILTTDDPYDEDPGAIAGAINSGIPASTAAEVLTILDRRQAIAKAISLAQPGEVIAITGMGAEASMMVKGKKVPWSDVDVARGLVR